MSDDNPSADDVYVDGDGSDNRSGNPLEENIKSKRTWLRFLFMLVSCVLASVATFAGSVIVIVGFFYVLFTGEVKNELRVVGRQVATYLYNIFCYLTFNTDEKPFPLGGDWPSAESTAD